MTALDFRRLALELPGAIEGSHMDHPDFRVGGKIFATLASPDEAHAMIKLTPEEQAVVMSAHPDVFRPASGKWGLGGATIVTLKAAKAAAIGPALASAHALVVAKLPKSKRP